MLQPGTVVNESYRIVRWIGSGGMGLVYEAENIHRGCRIALKILRPDLRTHTEARERFEREARLTALLHHENIVTVHDSGHHQGLPYIVMELLDGESLGDRLHKQHRLPIDEAARILGQVLAALEAAHARGVIHRDLKPDNVYLVPREDGREIVKLLDFGIARFQERALSIHAPSRSPTRCGTVMGTPEYMSPEQALARPDIDHRSDLYAAGVLLYQMVTGALPFQSHDDNQLLAEVAFQPNGVPSPRTLVPTLPVAFEALILRALARDRTQRFENAAAFAAALAPWAEETPRLPSQATTASSVTQVQKPSEHRPDRCSKDSRFVSRLRLRVIGTAALSVLIALGVSQSLSLRLHRRPAGPSQLRTPTVATVAAERVRTEALPSRVAVDFEGIPAGAAILLDGRGMSSPRPTFEQESTHVIRMETPAMRPFQRTATATHNPSIAPTSVPLTPTTSPSPPSPPKRRLRAMHVVRPNQHRPATERSLQTSKQPSDTFLERSHDNPLQPVPWLPPVETEF